MPEYKALIIPQTECILKLILTRSSAIAEGPRDALCQLKSCQLPHAVFRMAAVRHLGFLKFNFVTSDRLRDPFCISVPDFVKIGQTVAEISRFL